MKEIIRFGFALLLAAWAVSGSGTARAQGIGGPYTVDANTVVLLSFEDTFDNASDLAGDGVKHGNAEIFAQSVSAGLGKALYLDNDAAGDSSYVSLPDSDALDLAESFTVRLWFQVLTYGTSNEDHRFFPSVLWKRGSEEHHWSQGNYFVEVKGDTRYLSTGYYAPKAGGYPSIQSSNNLIEPGVWYHATLIRDARYNVIVQEVHDVDGALIYASQRPFNPETEIPNLTDWDLLLGWNGNLGGDQHGFCDCFIDEVEISNVVRGDHDIPPIVSDVEFDADAGMVSATAANIGTSALGKVELRWRPGFTGSFNNVAMTAGASDAWSAPLSASEGQFVSYYIRVENEAGQVTTLPADAESDEPSYFLYGEAAENDLTLHLDFETGSGDVVDVSTYGNLVVTGGDPQYAMTAKEGSYAMQFNGDTDYLQIGSPVIGDTEEYSFEMWVNVEDFQEDQTPAGNWQFWAIKPNNCAVCWGESTFAILAGAFDQRDMKIRGRFWIENADGAGANVEVPVDTALVEGSWYRILLENRRAAEGDAFDFYAMVQVRDENDAVISTSYQGYNGKPLNNPDLPLRLGIAEGNRFDDSAGFQGIMDAVKYYNYARGDIAIPDALPSVSNHAVAENATGAYDVSVSASPGLGAPLSAVTLHYGDGETFQEAAMTESGGMYAAELAAPAAGSLTYYYVSATNEAGHVAHLPEQAAADAPRYFDVANYASGSQLASLDFEGDSAADKSNAGHVVNVLGGASSFEAGAGGGSALTMDGVDDYLEVLGSDIGASESFSFDVWFKANDFREGTDAGNWFYLVNKPVPCDFCWGEATFSLLWGRLDNPNKYLAARFWNPDYPGTQVELEIETSMETGVWYHAVVQVEPGASGDAHPYYATLQLRNADDELLGAHQAGLPALPRASDHPVFIGHIGNRGFFDGAIDNFAFYNHAQFDIATSAEDEPELPLTYDMSQNYPNPFNPSTTISYQLPEAQHVTMDVFDVMGRKVATLVDAMQPAGRLEARFDAGHLASGIYLYRIQAGSFVSVRKMMLVK